MIHATQKSLKEIGDKASEEEKANIEKAIAELEEALKGDDKDAFEAKTVILAEACGTLAQNLYAEQAHAGEAQGSEQADGAGNADEVVDAEFEEVKDDGRK